ncbi:hypothetical protein IEQ34_005037 [Dendrobium chrysotoxum]|uniref:Large ribosomal subunit protein mL53 n=1 Tax=Dendrobium chrysotoxum TaxID=161865 RepID=A0AAV7H9Z4_DENCH|nr:hypothetical protein IEQ34_005037 [Dendrobium chrysotoxum]
MLKFLSKVNALDSRTAACMEFIAQCNAGKARDSNPACQVLLKRRTDDNPPQITVTYVNGVEEVIDAACTPAQDIRARILERGRYLETEQMFREAGEPWPVMIPSEELQQEFAAKESGREDPELVIETWHRRKYSIYHVSAAESKFSLFCLCLELLILQMV